MDKHLPLLPDTTFQPLSEAKLEAMIDLALNHPQETTSKAGNVIAFRRSWAGNMAFGGGMAAMAASVLLAFLLTPPLSTPTTVAISAEETTRSADFSDLLLYDTLGA